MWCTQQARARVQLCRDIHNDEASSWSSFRRTHRPRRATRAIGAFAWAACGLHGRFRALACALLALAPGMVHAEADETRTHTGCLDWTRTERLITRITRGLPGQYCLARSRVAWLRGSKTTGRSLAQRLPFIRSLRWHRFWLSRAQWRAPFLAPTPRAATS